MGRASSGCLRHSIIMKRKGCFPDLSLSKTVNSLDTQTAPHEMTYCYVLHVGGIWMEALISR